MLIRNYIDKDHMQIVDMITDGYELDRFVHMIKDTQEHTYVAVDDNKVLGICMAVVDCPGAFLFIYVDEHSRNQGIGTSLLSEMENHLKHLNVKCIDLDYKNETHNIDFFKNIGYHVDFTSELMVYKGERKNESRYEVRGYGDEDYLETRTTVRNAFHKMQVEVGIEAEDYIYLANDEERQEYLENKENIFLLIDNSNILGVLRLDGMEIDDIAVSPENQGNGYGRELLHFAINKMLDESDGEKIKLWCIVGNTAREFYLKEDFESVRIHDIAYKKL